MEKKTVIIPPTETKEVSNGHKAKKKVAAYCRVSTDSLDQENSFENQKEYYIRKISKNPEWIFVEIYADQGISGTVSKNRPEFQRMISDCLNGKIDIVLTKSISRFARNTVDALYYVRKLRAVEVSVVFEKERLDTSRMDDEMQLTIMSMFAQAESESISKNITWSLRNRFKKGLIYYGNNLYGYDRQGDTIVPREDTKEIIQSIFHLYIAGLALSSICDYLNESGVPSPNNTTWRRKAVQSILQNERYAGIAIMQKSYTVDVVLHKRKKNAGQIAKYLTTNAHTPIIDLDLYELVQKEIERRNTLKYDFPDDTQAQKYLGDPFSNFLYCGLCGNNFMPKTETRKRKGETSYKQVWYCKTRVYNFSNCSLSPPIERFQIEMTIQDSINYLLQDFDGSNTLSSGEIIALLGCDRPSYRFILEYKLYYIQRIIEDIMKKPEIKRTVFEKSYYDDLIFEMKATSMYIDDFTNIKNGSRKRKAKIVSDIENKRFISRVFDPVLMRQLIQKVVITGNGTARLELKTGKKYDVTIDELSCEYHFDKKRRRSDE